MGFSDDDANDLWSEIYINLIETKCVTYHAGKGLFPIWLKVVVKRAAYYRLRERARHPEIPLDDRLDMPCDDIFAEKNMSGRSKSQIQVRRATASLSKNDRTIIWDRIVEK
jgi:DNA-directed RNA polymerase specialized sigma24 family protein